MSGEKTCNSYVSATKRACSGNKNGFIYALVRVNKKDACVEMLSYSEDKDFYLNENSVRYIGVTNNPIARFQAHRCKKGHKMGMVVFDNAESPDEGKMIEANAIYNFCQTFGTGPKWQKGHDTWAGA
jgi:hypothetical protein